MPEGLQLDYLGYASDGSSQKYKCEGIAIDILSSGEQPEIVNGWRLAPIEGLIKAKYSYSQQKNPSAEKHHNDLIKLGFSFPKNSNTNIIPF